MNLMKIRPIEIFVVLIPANKWEKIKPISTEYKKTERGQRRKYTILAPQQWTEIVMEQLWKQQKVPCPYSFKRATVSENQTEYIKIEAQCKECGALA